MSKYSSVKACVFIIHGTKKYKFVYKTSILKNVRI